MSRLEPARRGRLLLAFDTSAPHCAACLVIEDQVLAELLEPMTRGQAERLMGCLQDVLTEGGAALGDIDAIAVGCGPGNFTGIRIAVAAARGLALALERPGLGVSLLEAAAFGQEGHVLACLPAPRGRVYLQAFRSGVPSGDPALADLSLLSAEDFRESGAPPRCVGPAAAEVAERLGAIAIQAAPSPAAAIGRIAMARQWQAAPRPAPLYLRPPEAAPARQARPGSA